MKILVLIILTFSFTSLITINAQTTILSEDFESGSLPAGWTRTQAAGSDGWLFGTNLSSTYWSIPSHTTYAASNDDNCDCNMSVDYLITPALDLTTYNAVVLNFEAFFDGAYGSSAYVRVSTDGGSTWDLVKTLQENDSWQTVIVNLTYYAGQSNIKIGFHHNDNGNWASGFAIDNVLLNVPLAKDAALLSINTNNYVVVGNIDVTGTIMNQGADTINSIDVNWSVDGGIPNTHNLSGLNIAVTETYDFTHSDSLNLLNSGTYNLAVWLSNVNGGMDGNPSNDSLFLIINVLGKVAQRLVLIEHFTNASCAPCAAQNPALAALMSIGNNSETIAHIAYHTSWPGTDPMYSFNTTESNARVNFYNVGGVPDAYVAGNQFNGSPASITQEHIDNEYERLGLFNIAGIVNYESTQLSIDILLESLTNFTSGSIKAYVVLIEHVTYVTPPGSNGETDFPDVMRKMFPNANGTNIGNPNQGDLQNLTFNYTVPGTIDIDNSKIIVFIQNNNDFEVYMTGLLLINDTTCSLFTTFTTDTSGNYSSATVNAYYGTPPYTYLWSNDSTTQNIDSLLPGTYIVTVTDSLGCSVIDSVKITISTNISGTNILCNGNCNGAADLTVACGTIPYSYLWSGGQTTEDLTNLCAGIYCVTVTDANLCTATDCIIITGPAPLTANISGTNVLCNGGADGNADLTVTGGTMPYSYSWSTAETTEDISGLSPGIYYVTVTDFNLCTTSSSVTITQPDTLISSITDTTHLLCYDVCIGSATVTPVGGTPPYTYYWYINDSIFINVDSVATNLCEGNHSVIIIDNHSCASSELFFTITYLSNLTTASTIDSATCSSITDDGAICPGAYGGIPPYSYIWSNDSITQCLEDIEAGEYSVTITDSLGCEIERTFTVPHKIEVYAFASSDDTICLGETVQLEGTGYWENISTGQIFEINYFEWNSPPEIIDSTVKIIFVTPDTTTIYYFTAWDDTQVCYDIDAVTIEVYPLLLLTLDSTDATCISCNDGSIDLTVTGGILPYTYLWSNGDTTEDPDSLLPGVYTVTVANACGMDSDSVEVGYLSSINEIADNSEINIYPNPTNGFLYITYAKNIVPKYIRIYNVIGEMVVSIENPKTSGINTIDMSVLTEGTYIIRILIPSIGIITKKVILVK